VLESLVCGGGRNDKEADHCNLPLAWTKNFANVRVAGGSLCPGLLAGSGIISNIFLICANLGEMTGGERWLDL